MANKKISDYSATTEILDTDNILIDRPTTNNYFKMDGATLKSMFGGDISLKADRINSASQQIPVIDGGDGFVKCVRKEGEAAWVSGSFSITANTLTEATQLACDFLYIEAKGYIWGLLMPEKKPVIEPGQTGEMTPKIRFERIKSVDSYEQETGHITLDETIYGSYSAIQNTLPIGVEIELTITSFNEGSDSGVQVESNSLTLDNDGLMNFNTQRVAGVAQGLNPTDAANFSQIMELISIYYNLYNQPTILSTPVNPPYNLTSVRINNKPGNITAEVGDAVQFTLPNSGDVFNGEISQIDGNDLVCSWTGYMGLSVDDAGTWDKRNITVDGVVYESEEFTIGTEYAPQYDGNGLNQFGSLGNHLAVDRVAQMSFVLNSIYRIGTKVVSQIIDPSDPMSSIVVLNRSLTNTEGLSPDVWYCCNIVTGQRLTMSSITGSGDTYILTNADNGADKIGITFLGENLPFVLPE